MFRLRGNYKGRRAEISWWDEGVLTGEEELVREVLSASYDVSAGGIIWKNEEVLKTSTPAFLLITGFLRDAELVEGFVIPPPEVPEGAIP